ncbi:hypothetical protein DPMN_131218 [Dreissena polymorpha]|uniref:Uncharacterized protein n=1 Tax=Dreissena polymorpha TaxID=45954 RepID=A0A9D4H474_DREPO|nr:hypothetical protein DPMN_131218 [Dreissena polymorpha]
MSSFCVCPLDEDQCRRALNRAHQKIVREMDPDKVLDELKKCGFLKQEEYDTLKVVI